MRARVLVVDDEGGILETFTSFLRLEGYHVDPAATVDAAVAALTRDEYDVVVADIAMPGRSGIELLALVRQLNFEAKVILVTGFPSLESAKEAIRGGAIDYLIKPVTRAALIQSVQAAFNVKRLEDEAREYRRRLEALVAERSQRVHSWEQRLQDLAEHVRGLGTSAGLSQLAPEVLRTLARLTLADSGSFYVREGDRFVLAAALAAPHVAPEITLPARPGSVTQRLLEKPAPLMVSDAVKELGLENPHAESYRGGSFLALPCVGGAGAVDALVFLYNRREGVFTEQDMAIGLLVAGRVEEAMRTAALLHALEEAEARRAVAQPQILVEQAEQIFRTVRHEIGNALNTLKTTLAVLQANFSRFDDAKRGEYFARCFESYRLAEQMLHALRAFQRFDQVRPVHLDLCRFLADKEGLIFASARPRGVECILDLRCSSAELRADPDALLRILLNLVENATTATSTCASPTIRVECGLKGDLVVLSVTDNGAGIPRELQKKVFEPLFSTKPDGSGLGLAIVQRLVIKLNGAIDLRSDPGAGTCVEIRLPRANAPGAPPPQDPQVEVEVVES